MKRVSLALIVFAMSTVLIAGTAIAVPITGEIHFGGFFSPTPLGSSFADATGIDITDAFVMGGTGSFSAIARGSVVDFEPLVFSPSTPATPLWSVSGFSFNLLSVWVDFQNAAHLALTGTGTLIGGPGFDDTMGSWSFSGDSGQLWFSFSSNSGVAPVPEPSTLLLLGSGLVGVATFRKRFKK